MKIGLILSGISPAGVQQLIQTAAFELANEHEMFTIEVTQKGNVSIDKMNRERLLFSQEFEAPLLKSSTFENRMDGSFLEGFDAVVVFGTSVSNHSFNEAIREHDVTILNVPMLGSNEDSTGNQKILGYDTALDSLVEHILKVKDTINSMKYDNPRLFGVQVPALLPKSLVDDVVLAVNEYQIQSMDQLKDVASKMNDTFSKGKTYGFLLFDETLQPKDIQQTLSNYIAVDWKYVQVDQSLCLGPYPSGADRLVANQLAEEVIRWCNSANRENSTVSI